MARSIAGRRAARGMATTLRFLRVITRFGAPLDAQGLDVRAGGLGQLVLLAPTGELAQAHLVGLPGQAAVPGQEPS
jgi:hypothetical protein